MWTFQAYTGDTDGIAISVDATGGLLSLSWCPSSPTFQGGSRRMKMGKVKADIGKFSAID